MEASLLEFLDNVKTSLADGNMHASETMAVVLLIAVVARSAELDLATVVILVAAVAVYIWHSTHSRTPAPSVRGGSDAPSVKGGSPPVTPAPPVRGGSPPVTPADALSIPAPPAWQPTPMQLARFGPLVEQLFQCGMTLLTSQHVNFLDAMAGSRKDHTITSVCKFIICSFVAKVNCGTDLSHLALTGEASMTKEQANTVVKAKVLAFSVAMKQCIKANFDKKERLVLLGNLRTNINSACRTWINRLETWEKTFGTGAANRMRDQMYADVGAKVGEIMEQAEKLSKPMDVVFREETMNSAQSLLEGIVHNSTLDKSKKDHLEEAMKVCDMKFKRMNEAFSVLQRTQASAEDLVKDYKDEQHALNRQMASKTADLELATSMKLRHGQGSWRIKNAPNDEMSRKLQMFWDQDKLTELFNYTSGNFECRFVPELTDTQKEVRAMQTTLEQDLKQFQFAKDELKEKNLCVVGRKAEVFRLTELFEKAKDDYKSAEQAMKVSSSTLPPAQAAEVSGLLRVAQAMTGTAGHFAPCNEEILDFKGALTDLKFVLDEKNTIQIVLVYLQALQRIANATDESNMVLLSHLGTVALGEFLLPNQDPGVADDLGYWQGETERMGMAVEDVQSAFQTGSEVESG